jgi:hypothetical protein
MFGSPAFKQFVQDESLPGGHVQTDDELLDYERRNGGTSYHASCTCMMGSHAMAVVDGELRVHGLDGLGVIDASVMPTVNLDQHQRSDDHDRREGCRDDKRRRAAKNGGVAKASGVEPVAEPVLPPGHRFIRRGQASGLSNAELGGSG